MLIQYRPIGYFHSPFDNVEGMPIQPVGGKSVEATIEILPEFRDGLQDLDGFSHLIVLSHLHRINGFNLIVKPFLDVDDHGIFATRSPKRPNPIGFSVMQLMTVTESSVTVSGVDILNGTPVLDIKPYVADFDIWQADRFGWFEGKSKNADHHLSDDRFV
ncbi:MAG: tRNA (N6-threonylcarbamoyladenosine(37)-N6)-methyltransferase TrmO [Desulfopila sp.]